MSLDMSLDDLVVAGNRPRQPQSTRARQQPYRPPQRPLRRSEPYGRPGVKTEDWEALVESVRAAQKRSYSFTKAWRELCDEKGSGSYDPAKYDEGFLRHALAELRKFNILADDDGNTNRASTSTMGSGRGGWGSGAGYDSKRGNDWNRAGGDEPGWDNKRDAGNNMLLQKALFQIQGIVGGNRTSHEKLVEEIKQVQRSHKDNTLAWRRYCEENGNGSYDPDKYDDAFLRRALGYLTREEEPDEVEVEEGDASSWEDAEEVDEAVMADRIKEWQGASLVHTLAWRRYCDERSYDSTYDPHRYDAAFLARAINVLGIGEVAFQDTEIQEWEPPAENWRSGPLTERVKQVQRSSFGGTKSWREHCTTVGDGNFDPAHYDASFLRGWLAKME